MNFIASVYPGIGLSCTIVLLALAIGQFVIYKKQGFERSKDLAFFCFFSSMYSLNIAISQSRQLSEDVTWAYSMGLMPILFVMYTYYLKSLAYYVVTPKWLMNIYYYGNAILGIAAMVGGLIRVIWDVDIYFDHSNIFDAGNYFVNSYTLRFGAPRIYGTIILSSSALLNIFMSVICFQRVLKTSKDFFIMLGLGITIFVSVTEHLILPLTLKYYMPLIFAANMVEALRMCFLATEESRAHDGQQALPKEDIIGFSEKAESEQKNETDEEMNTIYQNIRFDEERVEKLKEKLIAVMNDEKPFVNPNLSLEKLAHTLRIPSYQLTQVLHFGLNTNFYEFVNTYRVEEIQKKMADPQYQDTNILDIAFESGFNSKSSFNAFFKKQTGLTPSQYRKSVN